MMHAALTPDEADAARFVQRELQRLIGAQSEFDAVLTGIYEVMVFSKVPLADPRAVSAALAKLNAELAELRDQVRALVMLADQDHDNSCGPAGRASWGGDDPAGEAAPRARTLAAPSDSPAGEPSRAGAG